MGYEDTSLACQGVQGRVKKMLALESGGLVVDFRVSYDDLSWSHLE